MKYYTEIRGEIKEVKILTENQLAAKVEAYLSNGERVEAFRAKSELFTNKAIATKYFK